MSLRGALRLRSAAQKRNAQPVPHPLDSRFRGNDENDPPVIPGEHRETRNPGVPCFCFHAKRAALWGTRNGVHNPLFQTLLRWGGLRTAPTIYVPGFLGIGWGAVTSCNDFAV